MTLPFRLTTAFVIRAPLQRRQLERRRRGALRPLHGRLRAVDLQIERAIALHVQRRVRAQLRRARRPWRSRCSWPLRRADRLPVRPARRPVLRALDVRRRPWSPPSIVPAPCADTGGLPSPTPNPALRASNVPIGAFFESRTFRPDAQYAWSDTTSRAESSVGSTTNVTCGRVAVHAVAAEPVGALAVLVVGRQRQVVGRPGTGPRRSAGPRP